MRKGVFLLLMLFLVPAGASSIELDVDNIYGDYLAAGKTKTISMDLEGARLIDVLKVLSQQTGLNFVSTEAVSDRQLTLYFKDVPFNEAMDIIFSANGLAYDYFPEAKIFVVKEMGVPGLELKTKVYQLRYLRLASSRLQKEINKVLSGEKGGGKEEKSSDIKGVVEGVLTLNGRVVENVTTNTLIVVDVPSQFPVIDSVIKELDVPQPSVMIEVEMLDVSKTIADDLGFKFSNGLAGKFNGPSRVTAFPFTRALTKGVELEDAEDRFTFGTLSFSTLEVVMKFLQTDSTAKVIARPKILTLTNETAEVNITTDEAIGLITTTDDAGNLTQTLERAQTGTKLKVTPQVNAATGEVVLLVEVFNRTASDSGLVLAGNVAGTVRNPEERGAKSVVRLRDGDTLLMGGLIRSDTTDIRTKVPFAEKIPLLGSLFRSKNASTTQRELLVFLTPHIVKEPSAAGVASHIPAREQNFSARNEAIDVALDMLSRE